MKSIEKELAVVSGFIMYNRLLDDTEFGESYFTSMDKAIDLAESFIRSYPSNHDWESEDNDFESILSDFVMKSIDCVYNI